MQYKRLILKNFMSYENQVFDDLDRVGLTLIAGENGVGKSSLFDGISYALFGQTVRGLKGDEVIHRKFKKDCVVGLEFNFKGKEWQVFRMRKTADGDKFFIVVDGKTVELGTQAMTQQWLLDNLDGLDFDLYRSTVVFAQGETFNFANAGNKEQKEVLSKIMRINYDDHLKMIKNKLKELRTKKEDADRKIGILSSHLIEDETALYKEDIDAWYEKRNEKMDLKYKKIQDLKLKLDEAKSKDSDSTEIMKKVKEIEDKSSVIDERVDAYGSKISELKAEIALINKTLSEADILYKEPVCPLCKQSVDGLVLADKCKHLMTEKKEKEDEKDAIGEKLALAKENQRNLRTKAHDLRNEAMTVKMAANIVETVEEQIRDAITDYKNVKSEINPWLAKKEEAIEKQGEIRDKIDILRKENKSVEDILPYLDFWSNAFGDSGIKSFVFDVICSTLTTRSNYYLNLLTDGKVMVLFDTQKKLKSGDIKEKFDCEIIVDGQKIKYEAYSGGEKRRISLAIDMALADLMSDYYVQNFNIVTMDEQDSYLDNAGRMSYLSLLKEMAKNKHVFVIAHDDELKAMFDDVIEIKKIDGVSSIA